MATVVVLLGGCFQSYVEVGDDDVDASAEADGEVEADAVDEADAIPDDVADDDDVPAETDGATCPGWYDSMSGLCWQDPLEEATRNWDDAMAYCDDLDVAGDDDWHLPSINEL